MLGAVRMGALCADIEREALDGRLDRAGELMPALERAYDDLVVALEAST